MTNPFESQLIKKMKHNYYYFMGISAIYGLFFAVLLYRTPYGGGISRFLVSIVTVAVTIHVCRKMNIILKRKTYAYFGVMLLLGLNTVFRSSVYFHMFNQILFVCVWAIALISVIEGDSRWKIFDYIRNYIIFICGFVKGILAPFTHSFQRKYEQSRSESVTNTSEQNGYCKKDGKNDQYHVIKVIVMIVSGVIMAVIFLFIVIPLLVSTDEFFGIILKKFFIWIFNIKELFGIVLLFLYGFFKCYAFFTALFEQNSIRRISYRKNISWLMGISFLGVVTLVYVLFCIIQIRHLLSGYHTYIPSNLSYAQYARQGFLQLLFVALINLATVLLYDYIFEKKKISDIFLVMISICTFVMIFAAWDRIRQYIAEYGLTFLRILVIWFLITLSILFGGVIVYIIRESFPLFKYMAVVTIVCYLVLAYINVDKIIVRYNLSHVNTNHESGVDVFYMTYYLSFDAASYILSEDTVEYLYETGDDVNTYLASYEYYIDKIRSAETSVRGWNISISRAKDSLKNFEKKLEDGDTPGMKELKIRMNR